MSVDPRIQQITMELILTQKNQLKIDASQRLLEKRFAATIWSPGEREAKREEIEHALTEADIQEEAQIQAEQRVRAEATSAALLLPSMSPLEQARIKTIEAYLANDSGREAAKTSASKRLLMERFATTMGEPAVMFQGMMGWSLGQREAKRQEIYNSLTEEEIRNEAIRLIEEAHPHFRLNAAETSPQAQKALEFIQKAITTYGAAMKSGVQAALTAWEAYNKIPEDNEAIKKYGEVDCTRRCISSVHGYIMDNLNGRIVLGYLASLDLDKLRVLLKAIIDDTLSQLISKENSSSASIADSQPTLSDLSITASASSAASSSPKMFLPSNPLASGSSSSSSSSSASASATSVQPLLYSHTENLQNLQVDMAYLASKMKELFSALQQGKLQSALDEDGQIMLRNLYRETTTLLSTLSTFHYKQALGSMLQHATAKTKFRLISEETTKIRDVLTSLEMAKSFFGHSEEISVQNRKVLLGSIEALKGEIDVVKAIWEEMFPHIEQAEAEKALAVATTNTAKPSM